MNEATYAAVVSDECGAAFRQLQIGFVRVSGPDRAKFLQGQISNDVLPAQLGRIISACLLNNTGHLIALLELVFFEDSILISTDASRVGELHRTLKRYIVREKVEVAIEPKDAIAVLGRASELKLQRDVLARYDLSDFSDGSATLRPIIVKAIHRYRASEGFDVVVDRDRTAQLFDYLRSTDMAEIDEDTAHVLRVESGEPAWGAELDESIIPLEAALEHAISYTKGCYMGQEIIARIHSRGHTNRTLVGLRFNFAVEAGTSLVAKDGPKLAEDVGRVTSVAASPRFGIIGLGYVRNEYSDAGTSLTANTGAAVICRLPFTNDR